jgi:hypothetical protein
MEADSQGLPRYSFMALDTASYPSPVGININNQAPASIETLSSKPVFIPSISSSPATIEIQYISRAQLTFGLKAGCQVNVTSIFSQFLATAIAHMPNFSLLPLLSPSLQWRERATGELYWPNPRQQSWIFQLYYHNHRVLQHGNLTGMISFQCDKPWTEIKKPTGSFFQWLHKCCIYLNQIRFKANTLVSCGFLHGAHPGYLWRAEAEKELDRCLNQDREKSIPFQLSARTVSVPITDGGQEKFSFQAIVVETAIEHAAALWERFYSLGDPLTVYQCFQYVDKYQFIPLLKSREWSVDKIWRLAKFHDNIIVGLWPIFLQNLQDLNNKIIPTQTLHAAFMSMIIDIVKDGKQVSDHLLYSIHNTGNLTTTVALIPPLYYDIATLRLSAVHSALLAHVSAEYHGAVFLPGK